MKKENTPRSMDAMQTDGHQHVWALQGSEFYFHRDVVACSKPPACFHIDQYDYLSNGYQWNLLLATVKTVID
ncbi:hypothetical protein TNCV_479031 [Trichonephila clavipes]|nr:hypothetical protein TNCV_479031 [Trichonephila clavipes]